MKPDTLDIDLNFTNVQFLDGFHHDIPLKSDYVDCMIVIDLPQHDYLNPALKEWHRVLTTNGILTILTPTVLLENYDDPLTIGDFIEKHEPETIEHGVHIDKEHLKAQIKQYVTGIDEQTLVHMTVLRISSPIPS